MSKYLINLYKSLYADLVSLANLVGITEKELKTYFAAEGSSSPDEVLRGLCSSLQNSGVMRNSILFDSGKPNNNAALIRELMCDFDAEKALERYSCWQDIYKEVKKKDNGVKKGRETNWEKYCKGLYDGLVFLCNEDGQKKIESLSDKDVPVGYSIEKAIKEIETISGRIHGLGFALTCDWLKECGCLWLAKPDVHIKKAVSRLKELPDGKTVSDAEAVAYMYQWAETVIEDKIDNSVSAYKIDKIIWLLCTGNFYLNNIKFGRDIVYREIELNKTQTASEE